MSDFIWIVQIFFTLWALVSLLRLAKQADKLEADCTSLTEALGLANKDRKIFEGRAIRNEHAAELYTQIQLAAAKLPELWEICIRVERDGGGVELINPLGDEVEFPADHETMSADVADAIEFAVQQESRP